MGRFEWKDPIDLRNELQACKINFIRCFRSLAKRSAERRYGHRAGTCVREVTLNRGTAPFLGPVL